MNIKGMDLKQTEYKSPCLEKRETSILTLAKKWVQTTIDDFVGALA